jgi:hypothetical protein
VTCVAIYQPQYFPRLHYVNRALDADVFVLLASAKYTKSLVHERADGGRERHKSYQSHTPIKQPDGRHLLTVPVTSDHSSAAIDEVRPVDDPKWRRQHRRTLEQAYARARCYDRHQPEVDRVLDTAGSLADLNTASLLWALDVVLDLGLGTDRLTLTAVNDALASQRHVRLRRVVLDRDVGVERPEGRQMGGVWTASICEALGADEYLHGATAGTGYMAAEQYLQRGVTPVEQDWRGRPYPQQFEDRSGFVPNLSVLDLLFNVDPEEALAILAPSTTTASAAATARSR